MNNGKWYSDAVVEKPIKQTFGISVSKRYCLDTRSPSEALSGAGQKKLPAIGNRKISGK